VRRADDHHTSRGIKQLAPTVLMPIQLECRWIFVADGDDGAVDMLDQRWIGPRHWAVPLEEVNDPYRNAGQYVRAYGGVTTTTNECLP
jgi:hypothetical protein